MIETRIETIRPGLPERRPVRALFTAPGLAWVWLAVRVYLGWQRFETVLLMLAWRNGGDLALEYVMLPLPATGRQRQAPSD
jgi:hypothetical protein